MATLATIQAEAALLLADINAYAAVPTPVSTWPAATDCLGGVIPGVTGMIAAEQDLAFWNGVVATYDRMQANIAAGSVVFVGDSIIAGMSCADVTVGAVNHGIAGDTMRGVLNRLSRHTALRRAGAGVLLIGVNDLAYEGANFGVPAAVGDIDIMSQRIAGWITGKWVVVKILPVGAPFTGVANSTIDAANEKIALRFGANPACRVIDLKAQLAPNGSLAASFHVGDGVHPSAAAYQIIKSAIRDALQ